MPPMAGLDVLGQTIRARRQARGITQEELAERVGVTVETISRLERGIVSPSLTRLQGIAVALASTLSELLEPGPPSSRSARHTQAMARVTDLLRSRSVREIELIADVAERILRG